MTMSRALVTGAAGFLGSHLCDRLLSEGMEVVGFDSFVTGDQANIAHLATNRAFSFVKADVSQPYDIDGHLDIVFHLASPASPVDYLELPILTLQAGSYGTHNGLELARRKGAKFFLASTSEVYGDPSIHPQPEEYWGNVNPIGTRSCYDEAKRYGEATTFAYHRVYGIDTKVIRIFNTYGPRMRVNDGRVVPAFLSQALTGQPLTVYGDGSQTRSFCYVSDLVDGIYKLATSVQHGPINVGNPEERTMIEFANEILRATGSSSSISFIPLPTQDDPKQRRPDITKASTLLNWSPSVSLAQGLNPTIGYFKQKLRIG